MRTESLRQEIRQAFSCVTVLIRRLHNNRQQVVWIEFVKKLPTAPTGSGRYRNGVYLHRSLLPCVDNRCLLGMDGLRQGLSGKFAIGPHEKGEFITQLQTFALFCLYLLEARGERGPLVKTVTSSSMIDRLGELYNVPVFETTVGFKYVAPIMHAEDALIGGEESGGYGFRGHVAERDGILASLYFLDFMLKTGKTPSQLLSLLYEKVGLHYYHRRDVEFPEAERKAIIARLHDNLPNSIEGVNVSRIDTADGFRYILADNSWLLIRFSGTEPVLRIYAESNSDSKVKKLLEAGKRLAGIK